MKLEDSKHNHKLTNLLKVCLFGFIMILPFFAMLPSTLYFAFNEHAQNYTYQSVEETYEYETNEVNSVDDLVIGRVYKFEYDTLVSDNVSYTYIYTDTLTHCFNIIKVDTNGYVSFNGNLNDNDFDYLSIYFSVDGYGTTSQNRVFMSDTISNNYRYGCFANFNTITTYHTSLIIQMLELPSVNFVNYQNYISASDYLGEKTVTINESEQSPLNAFNTASSNVWNMPIFNWVTTGIGATALSSFISVFGITQNTFISNILIYWLTITTIYIVIDVVLTLFIELTHIITKKAR